MYKRSLLFMGATTETRVTTNWRELFKIYKFMFTRLRKNLDRYYLDQKGLKIYAQINLFNLELIQI